MSSRLLSDQRTALGLAHAYAGSADWQSAVSRIGNPQRFDSSDVLPTDSRRYSRLATCARVCAPSMKATGRLVLVLMFLIVFGVLWGESALGAEGAQPRTPAAGVVDPKLSGVVSQIWPQDQITLGQKFLFSYLAAFMFFLSICLGSLFLVLLHHLFDASWSVPTRRFLEHIASSVWVLGLMFLPILAFGHRVYRWMNIDPHADHALQAKSILFNRPTWTVISIALFGIWWLLASRLRAHSLAQDKDGAASHTYAMRKWAAGGIFVFALTLTLGAIFWMKSLQHAWFSTMYGVYYFAASNWTAVATAYVIMLYLKKTGPLRDVIHKRQIHDMGVLFFAFTVFYAYIHFSQYFLIWNAAIPEETFWYVIRENGSWWDVGMLIVFGHFFLPFLMLLRIDAKLSATIMVPMGIWAWLMHYVEMQFNVMPALYPQGMSFHIFDVICFTGIGFVLYTVFKKAFAAHAPYPIRDPRLKEALTHHEIKAASPVAIDTH